MPTLPRNFPEIDTGWLGVNEETSLSHFLECFREYDQADGYRRTPTARELIQYGIWIGLLIAADEDTPDPTPPIESFAFAELQLV